MAALTNRIPQGLQCSRQQ